MERGDTEMNLKQAAVLEEYYLNLKNNGWPKAEAAKAARRHVNQMTAREIDAEINRILGARRA
jgi:hypothetical protein